MSYRVNKEEIIYPTPAPTDETAGSAVAPAKKANSVWTEKVPAASENSGEDVAVPSSVPAPKPDDLPKPESDLSVKTEQPNETGSVELSAPEKYIKENGLEEDITDIDDLRAYLLHKNPKSPEESSLLESITNDSLAQSPEPVEVVKSTVKPQGTGVSKEMKDDAAKLNAQSATSANDDVKSEYQKLISQGGTDYEKLSRVLDKYLTENDPEYSKLPDYAKNPEDKGYQYSLDKKRMVRDKKIAQVRQLISNKNITQVQRNELFKNVSALYINAAVNGESVEDLVKQGKIAVNAKIQKIHKDKVSILNNIDLDDKNKTSNEILFEIADSMVSKSPRGAEYKKLSLEEKQKFLKEQIGDVTEKFISVNIFSEALTKEEKQAIGDLAVAAFRKMKNEGIDASTLASNTNKQQEFINTLLKDNKEIIDKIKNPETKKVLQTMMAKSEIYSQVLQSKNEQVTERDIFNKLEEMSKKGELKDDVYRDLYQKYSNMNTIDIESKKNDKHSKGLLDCEANTTSLASISTVLGMEPKRYIEVSLSDSKTGKPLEGEKLNKALSKLAKIINANPYSTDMKLLKDVLVKQNQMKDADIYAELVKAGFDPVRIKKMFIAQGDLDAAANVANDICKYGTKDQKEELKNTNKVIACVVQDEKKLCQYTNSLSDEAYNFAIKDVNGGVRKYYSQDKQNSYRNLSVSPDVPPERRSAFTSAWIQSGNATQQLEDQQYFLSLHDAAVTEGVAAAEKFVDASVRDKYSECLNNEINSGHYTEAQKAEFQTARETGQTSFDIANASEGVKSEQSSSNNKAVSSAESLSSSVESSQPVKITVGTLYISAESKTYANEIRATLAQLDSETKKADAMKKIADNIAKIQKDEIKYEAKAEQQKIAEQKQKAQEIQKENEKKTEEQKKKELAISLDSSLEEIKNELPQTPEAAEVQKLLGNMYNELKSYAQAGQIDQVFALLGKVPKAQEKFLEKLATKHISMIAHFLKGADKSILKFMCEKNPGIISTLDTSTLMTLCNAGFPKTMIIKYGDKNQVAAMLTSLQMASTKDTLNEFYEVMGLAKTKQDEPEAIQKVGSINGDDSHMAKLMQNMKKASIDSEIALSSNTVGGSSYRFPDGTKKKLDPKEFWG